MIPADIWLYHILPFVSAEQACELRLLNRSNAVLTYNLVTRNCDDNQKKVVWTSTFSSQCQSVQGGPGTGKSYVLRCISSLYTLFGIPFKVLAPTGTAAQNINGATVHSNFDLNRITPRKIKDRATDRKIKYKYLMDESSMISDESFQSICFDLGGDVTEIQAFNKVSITIFGDFRQLRPFNGRPIFNSALLRHFKDIRLTQNHRQEDMSFAASLNALGNGRITSGMKQILQTGKSNYENMDQKERRGILHLFNSNKSKDQWNEMCKKHIEGPERCLDVTLHRIVRVVKLISAKGTKTCTKKIFELDQTERAQILTRLATEYKSIGDIVKPVLIKKGFKVMVNRNVYDTKTSDGISDSCLKFSNGTTGVVTELTTSNEGVHLKLDSNQNESTINRVEMYHDIGEFTRSNLEKFFGDEIDNDFIHLESNYSWLYKNHIRCVETPNGEFCNTFTNVEEDTDPTVWKIMSDSLSLHISRIPLDVAFAITIYKSQGSTFKCPVAIKVDKLWPAVGYVALSRFADADDIRVVAYDSSVANINHDTAHFLKNGNLPDWPTQAQINSFRVKHSLENTEPFRRKKQHK